MEPTDLKFQYTPLPDPSTHIRLLSILEGAYDQRVVCELTTWELDTVPPYYAISYTWGDSHAVATINVNGKETEVRQNCEFVLRQSFASQSSQYYWCDAICINQTDVSEKNQQVAMFGKLYEKAEHVLVCVGRHEDDSDILFEILKQKQDLLNDILQHSKRHGEAQQQPAIPPRLQDAKAKCQQALRMPPAFFKKIFPRASKPNVNVTTIHEFSMWSGVTEVDGRLVWVRCCLNGTTPGREGKTDAFVAYARREVFPVRQRIINAFIAFMQRPYFSRLWVLQELQLGRKKFLCCGNSIHAFDSLFALHQLVRVWLWDLYPRGRTGKLVKHINERSLFSVEAIKMAEKLHTLEYQLGCLKLGVLGGKPTDLPHLLSALEHFACADARDKIYGTFTLATWEQWIPLGHAFHVNYDRDAFAIARDVMSVLLLHLSFVAYGEAGLAYVDRAKCLRTLLQYSPQDSSMARAHAARFDPVGEPPAEFDFWRARLPDIDFQGVMLHPYNKVRERGDVHCRPGTGVLPEIVNDNGEILAYAPPGTAPGDWLLVRMPWFAVSRELLGIVVKIREDGKHELLGLTDPLYWTPLNYRKRYTSLDPGLWPQNDHPSRFRLLFEKERFFKIRWSAEDLLFFEWKCAIRKDFLNGADFFETPHWCQQRVCIYDGSSYAMGPYDDYMAFWQPVEGRPGFMGWKPFDV